MKQDERDLLIKVATTVEAMKDAQIKMDVKLEKHIEKDDRFLTKSIALWIGGVFMTIMIGAYAYTTIVDQTAHLHQTNMVIHHLDTHKN